MRRALLIDPDNPVMRYNFVCALAALLGDTDGALAMLAPILAKTPGFMLSQAKIDPDLASVRDDPRFKAMMAEAEARLAAEKQG